MWFKKKFSVVEKCLKEKFYSVKNIKVCVI